MVNMCPRTSIFWKKAGSVTYATMFAQPIKRQCLSILRLRAIFSPISVQAGLVKLSFAASALTPMTLAPVAVDPMFTMRTSFFDSLATLACVGMRMAGPAAVVHAARADVTAGDSTERCGPTAPRRGRRRPGWRGLGAWLHFHR